MNMQSAHENPLRLAIVGSGAIAEQAHIPATERIEVVRLVGLVDSDLEHARAVASRYGIPRAAADLDELVGEVDAVILATPPHVRGALACRALKHGLHVLCEKPMANSSAECRKIIEAARSARRVLAVGHNYRFFPNRAHAWSLYRSGRLGRMISVNVEQGEPFGSSSRTFYTLRKELVPGGVLFNEGVHVLDLFFWWFGEPESFDYQDDSLGGLESNVRLTLNYRGGGVASYRLSRTCFLSNSVDMRFEKGTLAFPLYDMAALTLGLDRQSGRLSLHTKPWDFVESAALQLEDFASAALDERPPLVDGEAGLAVVGFIESCYQRAARRSRSEKTPVSGLTW